MPTAVLASPPQSPRKRWQLRQDTGGSNRSTKPLSVLPCSNAVQFLRDFGILGPHLAADVVELAACTQATSELVPQRNGHLPRRAGSVVHSSPVDMDFIAFVQFLQRCVSCRIPNSSCHSPQASCRCADSLLGGSACGMPAERLTALLHAMNSGTEILFRREPLVPYPAQPHTAASPMASTPDLWTLFERPSSTMDREIGSDTAVSVPMQTLPSLAQLGAQLRGVHEHVTNAYGEGDTEPASLRDAVEDCDSTSANASLVANDAPQSVQRPLGEPQTSSSPPEHAAPVSVPGHGSALNDGGEVGRVSPWDVASAANSVPASAARSVGSDDAAAALSVHTEHALHTGLPPVPDVLAQVVADNLECLASLWRACAEECVVAGVVTPVVQMQRLSEVLASVQVVPHLLAASKLESAFAHNARPLPIEAVHPRTGLGETVLTTRGALAAVLCQCTVDTCDFVEAGPTSLHQREDDTRGDAAAVRLESVFTSIKYNLKAPSTTGRDSLASADCAPGLGVPDVISAASDSGQHVETASAVPQRTRHTPPVSDARVFDLMLHPSCVAACSSARSSTVAAIHMLLSRGNYNPSAEISVSVDVAHALHRQLIGRSAPD